jgi:hypothetical protein
MGRSLSRIAQAHLQVVAPFSGASEGVRAQERRGRQRRRTAEAENVKRIEEAEASRLAEEKERSRRRIFSGIRTPGGQLGITGGEQIGRTRLLG